ncbi:MAG TPA: flavodoxin/nitric oxide synthase [Dermatophilaceae bacterium]|nr:flavodoxin/nitric oxide synthase [Dermatophilaceae bacterium]
MRALVVFESIFGNTEAIARAVADGLGGMLDVDVVEVGHAPKVVDDGYAVLVVGGPTHAFGMSRPQTRLDAARQAGRAVPSTAATMGIREWIELLGQSPGTVAVATFDTRMSRPRLPGSAARAALRRLHRQGWRVVAPPESFWVSGSAGPLVADETARARRWGQQLADAVAADGHPVR